MRELIPDLMQTFFGLLVEEQEKDPGRYEIIQTAGKQYEPNKEEVELIIKVPMKISDLDPVYAKALNIGNQAAKLKWEPHVPT